MIIAKRQPLPEGKLLEATLFSQESGCPIDPVAQDIHALTRGKTIVLFGVPGAFTPLCSESHLPGFIGLAAQIKAAGADEIWCMAVNDPFVMAAWGKQLGVGGNIRMMADGSAALTKALGIELDLVDAGLGVRCRRFAMIVKDGVVSYMGVESGDEFDKSKAETVLMELQA